MAWKIEYTRTALEQLRKLDRQIAGRLLDYMDQRIAVLDDPRSMGKALTGPKGGLWRYRVGDYRLVCDIDDHAVTILVLQLGHRSRIYR